MKIRIEQPGFAGYTGQIGPVTFVDGVADVSVMEARRLGAAMRIVDAETDEPVGPAADMARNRTIAAPLVVDQPVQPEPKRAPGERVAGDDEGASEPKLPKLYTYAELAEIADSKGIAGLRELAQTLNVRGRGIAELIAEIAKAQKQLIAARGLDFDMGQAPAKE